MPSGQWAPNPGAEHHIMWPCGPNNSAITREAWLNLATGGAGSHAKVRVWCIRNIAAPPDYQPTYPVDQVWDLKSDTPHGIRVPDNTDQIHVQILEATHEIGWALEAVAK